MERSSRGYGILLQNDVVVGEATTGKAHQRLRQQQQPLDRRRRRRSLQSSMLFTNDSSDVEIIDDRIDVRDGYPIRYKCMDAAMAATTTSPTTVEINNDNDNNAGVIASILPVTFSYEVTMRVDGSATFSDNLKALEWSVLWNIVSNIGLHRCDFQKQDMVMEEVLSRSATTTPLPSSSKSRSRNNGVLRRRTQSTDTTSLNSSLVLSLTSDSIDTIDTRTVRCQHSPPTNKNTVCTPMTGNMNMVYTGDNPAMMERFLLAEIQKVMTSPVVLVQDVGNVFYVGQRQVVDGALADPTGQMGNQGNNESMSALLGITIGVGIVAMSVIVIFVALGMVRKKRQLEKLKQDLAHVPSDVVNTDSFSSTSPRSDIDEPDEYSSSSSSGAKTLHIDTNVGDGDSLSQEEYQHNGVIFMRHEAPSSESVYLTSNPMHRKRRRAGRRNRQAFRARVAMAPMGIESIPEIPEDEFDSSMHASVEEKDDSPSESDGDEGNYSSSPQSTKQHSQTLSGFSSPKGFQSPGLLPQDGGKPKSRKHFLSPGLDPVKSTSPAVVASDNGWANFENTIPGLFHKTTPPPPPPPPRGKTLLSRKFFPEEEDSPKAFSKRSRRRAEV